MLNEWAKMDIKCIHIFEDVVCGRGYRFISNIVQSIENTSIVQKTQNMFGKIRYLWVENRGYAFHLRTGDVVSLRLISKVDGTFETPIQRAAQSFNDLDENAYNSLVLLRYLNSYEVSFPMQNFQKWLSGPCGSDS